jgi:hypothetical protein
VADEHAAGPAPQPEMPANQPPHCCRRAAPRSPEGGGQEREATGIEIAAADAEGEAPPGEAAAARHGGVQLHHHTRQGIRSAQLQGSGARVSTTTGLRAGPPDTVRPFPGFIIVAGSRRLPSGHEPSATSRLHRGRGGLQRLCHDTGAGAAPRGALAHPLLSDGDGRHSPRPHPRQLDP